jgi:hypothetical protein
MTTLLFTGYGVRVPTVLYPPRQPQDAHFFYLFLHIMARDLSHKTVSSVY